MAMVIVFLVIAPLTLWLLATRRSLTLLEENADDAMRQLGLHLASCCDAAAALLDAVRDYDIRDTRAMAETLRSERRAISTDASPEDIRRLEAMIDEMLRKLDTMSPPIGGLGGKCREEVACYGAMVQSSRLRYNNAAANLNRSLLRFPTRLIAGALGFHRRAYLEY